ncbi:MAG: hypothetical protein GX423_07945 [Nitrospiraceae bacterium]|jgi:hypothetical protein|nr:hypothetical protein [Nitrospiraceae bacterium]
MKKYVILLMIALVVFVAGCGKKAVKPVSADSKTATEAFALIENVRQAYVNRNMTALQAYTTPEGFQSISSMIKPFDSVKMEFRPMLVDIRDGVVTIYVSWTGVWMAAGQKHEERGLASFALKGAPLKVDNVLRASPFRYPEQ